jgi:excisionase family DNA binding protein
MPTDHSLLAADVAPLLSRAQAAELLGTTPRTIDRYVARGMLAAIRISRRNTRISRAAIEKMLAAAATGPRG